MATDRIEYYFWINSDWAYFGNPRLADIAEKYGLAIDYYPIDFTTVFDRTGGLKLPLRAKERQDYRLLEMARYRDILGMPINLKPKYPATNAHLPSFFVIAAAMVSTRASWLCRRCPMSSRAAGICISH